MKEAYNIHLNIKVTLTVFLTPVYAWPVLVLATETKKALTQSWSMSLFFLHLITFQFPLLKYKMP